MERDAVPKALRKIALDFAARVIKKTPVDTGRARAGWTAILDARGAPIALGGDPQAVAEGKELSDFEENFGGPEQHILIINGVRYVVFLEFGSSDQAPKGMVRITLREMQRLMLKDIADAFEKAAEQANRGR